MSKYYLSPETVTSDSGWAASSGTIIDCIDDPYNSTNSTNYVGWNSGVADGLLRMTAGDLPSTAGGVTINSVSMFYRAGTNVAAGTGRNIQAWIYIGGVKYTDTVKSLTTDGEFNNYTKEWVKNPATNQRWTYTEVNALEFGWETFLTGGTDRARFAQTYLEVDFDPIPTDLYSVREVGSRRLQVYRRGRNLIEVTCPLEFLDADILSDIAFSHINGQTPDGSGWGIQTWARRWGRVIRTAIDPMNNTVTITCRDMRWSNGVMRYWDGMRSKISGSVYAQGVPRIGTGGTRSFSRTSRAYIEDPGDFNAGSNRVIEVGPSGEKFDRAGELLESASTNNILRSTFADGLTGWTTTGTVATDGVDLLFDSNISVFSCKLTADNPVVTGAVISQTTASITSGTNLCLSVDHKDDDNQPLTYSIQRAIDSGWWNNTLGTWVVGSGEQENTFPTSTSITRGYTKTIAIGGSNTTVTVNLKAKTAGTQDNHIYHVQLESKSYPTSRMFTTTATQSRTIDNLTVTLPSQAKAAWYGTRGTMMFDFAPEWDADSAGSSTFTLVYISYDANNSFEVYWDGADDLLKYKEIIAGNSYTATCALTPARETYKNIAIRRTSADGELGLTPYTMSVFVNGTKGTDAVAVAPSPVYPATMNIGFKSSAAADGWMRNFRIYPVALHDREIATG